MTHARSFPLMLLLNMMLFGPFSAHADQSPLPSYEQQRQQFMEQQKNAPDAPAFSEQDRRIMKQAAQKLADQLPQPGLQIGTRAPDFTLTNAFGKPVSLSAALNEGPVVLVFYRGAWCPFCNLHLQTLQKSLPEFKKYGAQLIAITPQQPDKSAEQIGRDGYPFEVLSDLDSAVMKAYGLYYELDPALVEVYLRHNLDVAAYNGEGRNVLPVPGTLIIDQQGMIRGVHADVDYKERMEPAAILGILRQL